MALSFQWMKVLLFILLSTLGTANVYPRRDGFTLHVRQADNSDSPDSSDSLTLRVRQDNSGSLDCVARCDPSTCGSACGPSRRGLGLGSLDFPEGHTPAWNYSSGGEGPAPPSAPAPAPAPAQVYGLTLHLAKRLFASWRWNQSRAARYLSEIMQTLGSSDSQFETLTGFFAGDERTIAAQGLFGDTGFQYGTGGLHGCTMLTVVSNRAVYMAHYWETYSTNTNDNADFPRWQERVLNTVSGQGPTDSNLPPRGGSLDPNNFNQPGDQTRAYIMSPLGDGIRESNSNSENDFKYPTKVRQLRALLSTLVPGVQIVMKGYQRLNYAIPAEREQENTNERGIALFQYDPNSDGNGQRAYRLFYQQTVYEQNV